MQRVRLTFPDRDVETTGHLSVWSIEPSNEQAEIDGSAPAADPDLPADDDLRLRVKPIEDPSLVGRVLTRRMLAEQLHLKSHQVYLTKDERGRPSLDSRRMASCPKASDLDFSCSHSEKFFAVGAIEQGRIGIDIEVIRPDVADSMLSSRELCETERTWIGALPEDERPAAFYYCWTAKEALLKALGLGVSFGMEQIEILRDETGGHRFSKIADSRQLAEGWSLEHHYLEFDDASALAAIAWAR
jgi:4'-phosphopantetheinyl transferase